MRLELESPSFSATEVDEAFDTAFSAPSFSVASLVTEGVAAAQRGDRAHARTLLMQATDADPRNADAWMWLASISEYPEELLVFLNNVLDIEPENKRALEWRASTTALIAKTFVQRGVAAQEEGQNGFAMDCFDKAIESDPNCEVAWFWKASMAGSEDETVGCLEKVLAINPDNADARSALDKIHASRSEARFREVQLAVVEKDWSTAIAMLDEYLASDLSNLDAWKLRSHLSPSIEEKLLSYERVLAIDPDDQFASAGRSFLQDLVDAVRVPAAEPAVEMPEAIEKPAAEFENVEAVSAGPASEEVSSQPEIADQDTDESLQAAYLESVSYFEDPAPAEEEAAPTPEFDAPEHVDDPHADQFDGSEPVVEVAADPFVSYAGEPAQDPVENVNHDAERAAAEFISAYENRFSAEPQSEAFSMEEAEPEDTIHLEETVVPSWSDGELSVECPFCAAKLSHQAFSCRDCRAILSLSDVDSMLANDTCDLERIHEAVTEMEAAWNMREFSSVELKDLGMGHLNLKNFDRGLRYLQEAVRLEPNDVILGGEVNAIAIRLDELRRQEESHEIGPKGCAILVVDDSATVRKLISNKLEKHGHTVICAADGVEAMEAIDNFTPELVLLDITMPRMDGYQVCKMIRAHETAKDVPVVMISGKDGFFDKVRGKMSGCTGYITKPFGPETLMKALDTYLVPAEIVVE